MNPSSLRAVPSWAAVKEGMAMIRFCSECEGCKILETVQGNIIHVCLDEEGGAYLQEVGLCGWCGEIDEEPAE